MELTEIINIAKKEFLDINDLSDEDAVRFANLLLIKNLEPKQSYLGGGVIMHLVSNISRDWQKILSEYAANDSFRDFAFSERAFTAFSATLETSLKRIVDLYKVESQNGL